MKEIHLFIKDNVCAVILGRLLKLEIKDGFVYVKYRDLETSDVYEEYHNTALVTQITLYGCEKADK